MASRAHCHIQQPAPKPPSSAPSQPCSASCTHVIISSQAIVPGSATPVPNGAAARVRANVFLQQRFGKPLRSSRVVSWPAGHPLRWTVCHLPSCSLCQNLQDLAQSTANSIPSYHSTADVVCWLSSATSVCLSSSLYSSIHDCCTG
jgi:hypothetical protein